MHTTYSVNSFQLILIILAPIFVVIGYIIYDKSQTNYQTILASNKDSQKIQIAKEVVKSDVIANSYPAIGESNLEFEIDLNNLTYALPKWDLMCLPKVGTHCEGVRCESIKPTVFLLVDMYNQVYSRCDMIGCDTYQYTSKSIEEGKTGVYPVNKSGGFVLFGNLYDRLSKIDYRETALLLSDSYVYDGSCVWH